MALIVQAIANATALRLIAGIVSGIVVYMAVSSICYRFFRQHPIRTLPRFTGTS